MVRLGGRLGLVWFITGLAVGGKNRFLPLVLTGLNRLAETPSGQNWQNRQKLARTVGFLVSNCLKCKNMCVGLDVIGTYCELCLIGFLVGDYIKCVCMFLVTIGICLSACKAACNVLYTPVRRFLGDERAGANRCE